MGSSPTIRSKFLQVMQVFFCTLGYTKHAKHFAGSIAHRTLFTSARISIKPLLPSNSGVYGNSVVWKAGFNSTASGSTFDVPSSLLKSKPSLFSQRRQPRFSNVRNFQKDGAKGFFGHSNFKVQPSTSLSLVYARRRVASLFRRGQRAQRERAVRSLALPAYSRGSTATARQRRERFVSIGTSNLAATELLRPLPLSLPPFVALRIRRRTKRAAPRIRHLTRLEGQRIALRNLTKALQRPSRRPRASSNATGSSSGGAVSSALRSRLIRTLSALSSPVSSAKAGSSALRERREEIHEQARKARPRN